MRQLGSYSPDKEEVDIQIPNTTRTGFSIDTFSGGAKMDEESKGSPTPVARSTRKSRKDRKANKGAPVEEAVKTWVEKVPEPLSAGSRYKLPSIPIVANQTLAE